MWVYWVMFWWPALAAISFNGKPSANALRKLHLLIFAFVLCLVIGLRYEVGMDWGNYLEHLYLAQDLFLYETLLRGDIGYWFLNWLAARTGSGIWLVNLVAATAFVGGLTAFCSRLPNPWLAITIALPYMAIVMAMNYTRQGAAFGLVLLGLLALQDGRIRRFVLMIIAAALFHKTAVILLPLAALLKSRRYWVTLLGMSVFTVLAYLLFLAETYDALYETYIYQQYASDGAGIRIFMNAAAAITFIVFRKRYLMPEMQKHFWTWISVIALLFIPALMISPSSTAVDRVALYFMPLQLIAFSYFPFYFLSRTYQKLATLSVVGGFWLVMFVWFNYSNFYFAWLPYRFYPFE